MKTLRYLAEAAGLYVLYYFFAVLPPEKASNIGGWLGRKLGPRAGITRTARRNLDLAFPDKSAPEKDQIILDMWDNLGRVIAEYPHLEDISRIRTDVEGTEILESLFESDHGAVFIGAHLGNWEVNCAALLTQFGQSVDLTYRAPNNPWADRLIRHARTLGGQLPAHPKSRDSGRQIIAALKDKRYLGILIDQKYNEGIAVPFFGHAAMTNPVFVQLAQKYECPVIPVRCERTGPAQFKLTVYEPLNLDSSVETIMAEAHRLLEIWIAENPGQWLWLHRRWSSKAVRH